MLLINTLISLCRRATALPFYPLDVDAMKNIVQLKLNQPGKRLKNSDRMKLNFDPRVVDQIAQRYTEVETGARNIDHIMSSTCCRVSRDRDSPEDERRKATE